MPPLACTNRPCARRARVGERALDVAEQLALEQRLGHRGAVDRDERAGRCRLRWWIARATSSLPVPLSPVISTVASVSATRSMRSYTFCIGAARADHLDRGRDLGRPTWRSRLTSSRSARCCDGAREREPQRLDLERLGDEVVGAGADRADRRLEAAERGDHDDRHVGPIGDDALAQLEAVHALHVEVGDDDVEVLLVEQPRAPRLAEVFHVTTNPRRVIALVSVSAMLWSSSTMRT